MKEIALTLTGEYRVDKCANMNLNISTKERIKKMFGTELTNGDRIFEFISPHLGSLEVTEDSKTEENRILDVATYNDLIDCLLTDLVSAYRENKGKKDKNRKAMAAEAKRSLDYLYQVYFQEIYDENCDND